MRASAFASSARVADAPARAAAGTSRRSGAVGGGEERPERREGLPGGEALAERDDGPRRVPHLRGVRRPEVDVREHRAALDRDALGVNGLVEKGSLCAAPVVALAGVGEWVAGGGVHYTRTAPSAVRHAAPSYHAGLAPPTASVASAN